VYKYQGIRGWWEWCNEILTIQSTQWRNCEWKDNRDVFKNGKYNRKWYVVVNVPAVTSTVHTCFKSGRTDKYALYLVHSLARSFQLPVSYIMGSENSSSGGKLAESWSWPLIPQPQLRRRLCRPQRQSGHLRQEKHVITMLFTTMPNRNNNCAIPAVIMIELRLSLLTCCIQIQEPSTWREQVEGSNTHVKKRRKMNKKKKKNYIYFP